MKRLLFIAVCVMGAGQLFAAEKGPVLYSASAEYQNRPRIFTEIYAVSQEKPQALSAAGAKTGDSAETGIKDTTSKGLPAAISTSTSNPPQSPFFKGGDRGGEKGFTAAVFAPLRL